MCISYEKKKLMWMRNKIDFKPKYWQKRDREWEEKEEKKPKRNIESNRKLYANAAKVLRKLETIDDWITINWFFFFCWLKFISNVLIDAKTSANIDAIFHCL